MASVTFEPRRRATRKLVLLDTADVTRPPWRFTRESASSLRSAVSEMRPFGL